MFGLDRRQERPLAVVPRRVMLAFACLLVFQVAGGYFRPEERARHVGETPTPPSLVSAKLAALGDDVVLARLLDLYVQSLDVRPGVLLPLASMDYTRVIAWLRLILGLDPNDAYPLLLATRVYSFGGDDAQRRQMLDFVYQAFREDPNRRWRWLAEAVIVARHSLKDNPLALKYAHALRTLATGKDVPSWAKQAEIFLLEDLDEYQAAQVLLGGLIESGQVTDPVELHFLLDRLEEIKRKVADPKGGVKP